MTFECSGCHMRYRIDDSIVPRGGARVRCRQCSTMILIPEPAVVPPPANLDLIPPAEAPRPRQGAPSGLPSSAPDWLTSGGPDEAPAPPRMAEAPVTRATAAPPRPAPVVPPPAPAPVAPPRAPVAPTPVAQAPAPTPAPIEPTEPVGGLSVVGESQQFESFAVERFAAPTPPPSSARDAAFEDIGMSVARFETGPAMPTAEPERPAPVVPAPPPPAPRASAPVAPVAAAPPLSRVEPPVSRPAPPRPAAPPSQGFDAPVEVGTGNVVPLTLGTPIPGGLPPDERARHEKARRLARVLASDIAIYNREKKDRGIQEGNLVAVLGYEIKKSWETYKERVGAEFANSTPYFRDALNDMLAEGKKVF